MKLIDDLRRCPSGQRLFLCLTNLLFVLLYKLDFIGEVLII